MKNMKKIKNSLLSFAAVLCFSAPAIAQTIAPQPCDSRYWEQLESRALVEAEREIMQNQNLIFKADSVFEYTCFDRLLAHTALHSGNIFSHSTYFGTPIIPPNSSRGLTASMSSLVFDALRIYIDSNFDHTYLGGRANLMSASPADTNMNTGGGGGPGGSLYSGSYGACGMMAGIWQASKCMNFVDNSNFQGTDGFYPLLEIRGHAGGPTIDDYVIQNRNTRQFPTACAGNVEMFSQTGGSLDWFSAYQRAINWNDLTDLGNPAGADILYPFHAPNRTTFTDVGDKTRPGNCGTPGQLSGLEVIGGTGITWDEPVCTNVGCTPERNGNCS